MEVSKEPETPGDQPSYRSLGMSGDFSQRDHLLMGKVPETIQEEEGVGQTLVAPEQSQS